MHAKTLILATACVLAPTLACDTMEDPESTIAVDLRDDPMEFWESVTCYDGTTCWALHPYTTDAWTRVQTWAELDFLVEVGRLEVDPVGGFGPYSCAPEQFPDSYPVHRCYRIVGSVDNICYGGGDSLATEITPTCDLPLGYSATHYVAVGCTSNLGDSKEGVQLLGHVTQLESGLLIEGNGAMLVAPSCHVAQEP